MNGFRNTFFTLSFILAVAIPPAAQVADSIKAGLDRPPRLDLRLDSRYSFFSFRAAKVYGVKIGLDYSRTVKFGLGYNRILFPFSKELVITDAQDIPDTVKAELKYAYLSPYVEYVFYRKGAWELSIPVQIGVGATRYEYKNSAGEQVKQPGKPVISYEPAMAGHWRFIRYAAIGFGAGYRLILLGNKALNENFNAPVYIVKLKLFVGDMYRGVFPNK